MKLQHDRAIIMCDDRTQIYCGPSYHTRFAPVEEAINIGICIFSDKEEALKCYKGDIEDIEIINILETLEVMDT